MAFRFLLFLPVVLWAATSLPSDAQTASQQSDNSVQRLIGTWSSNDPSRAGVKTFGADGTYTEVLRLLGTRAMVNGIYRVEGEQLWWVEQRLTVNRAGGDVLSPKGHVRLNEAQRAKIKWKGADE